MPPATPSALSSMLVERIILVFVEVEPLVVCAERCINTDHRYWDYRMCLTALVYRMYKRQLSKLRSGIRRGNQQQPKRLHRYQWHQCRCPIFRIFDFLDWNKYAFIHQYLKPNAKRSIRRNNIEFGIRLHHTDDNH